MNPNYLRSWLRLGPARAASLLLLPLFSPAASVQAQFEYRIDNGTITITGYTGPGGAVVIPDTINSLPVTSIGQSAFELHTSLTSVTIPDSVASIGRFAFARCDGLPSVTVPGSVTNIAGFAFFYCTSLSAITVDASNSVYSSVDGVLFNKSQTLLIQYPGGKAGSYTIPNSLRGIADNAFYFCTNLTSVTIPNSVTSIGNYAFASCISMTSVSIPNSVTNIGESAFYFCLNLNEITVDSLNAFYSSMDGVLFDKSRTVLIQCPAKKSGGYMIPNSVTNIGDWAFIACTSLTGVAIPDSVISIGADAFNSCIRLTNITIPNSVTSIGAYSFASCNSLTNLTIPDSIKTIPSAAFSFCHSLSSVTIPNSITNIGDSAFAFCTKLTSATIPNSVTTIGNGAFYACTNLTGVYFQGNAPGVGSGAFFNANNAIVYYLPGTTGWGTTFEGRPTALWTPRVETSDANFGVRTNQFGFDINWASDLVTVVEACTNLTNPVWTPVGTNTLTDGSSYFSDPEWTNHPVRFYRLRSP